MLNAAQLVENISAQWEGDEIRITPCEPAVNSVDMENARLRRRLMQLETEVLALRRALERERHRANIDPLTGIANRRA